MPQSIPTIESLGFESTQDYQEFHGLYADNIPGPITQKHLSLPRICSRPDIEHYTDENQQLQKWPFNDLMVSSRHLEFPSFPITEIQNTVIQALQSWADVANLNFTITTNQHAHIELQNGIFGSPHTLAYSDLPNSFNCAKQNYSKFSPWDLSSNPSKGKIDLLSVMVHELGHALGLSHVSFNLALNSIMGSFYNPNTPIREPLQGDIERIQALYGKPLDDSTKPIDSKSNDPPLATGKLLLKGFEFTPMGLVLDISELPDD